jgi:hypothetical protein
VGQLERDSYRVIAERTGRDRVTIRAEHIRAGTAALPVRARDGRCYPGTYDGRHERDERIRELRERGISIRRIAAELGCSTYTVQYAIGVPWTKSCVSEPVRLSPIGSICYRGTLAGDTRSSSAGLLYLKVRCTQSAKDVHAMLGFALCRASMSTR